jgi:uncharacterized protein (TIGR03118 family)
MGWLALALMLMSSGAWAQYKQINLVSSQTGMAKFVDSDLVNAWGISLSASGPFWISDNVTGLSTLYTGQGVKQGLVVTIPAAGTGLGSPTGTVFNGSAEFVVTGGGGSGPALFLFATLDGTISGWNPSADPTNAIIAVNNVTKGTSYTGLAITTHASGNMLYAADTANDKVDVYDGKFNFVTSLIDSTIPHGFTPYGVADIHGRVYVTYASTGTTPGGFIDVFAEDGTFVKRFTQGKPLNQPWGMAYAPPTFGAFSNDLLITNNLPNGTINAFNPSSGKFVGTLQSNGKAIVIDQLWGIAFGEGNVLNGFKNQLFFSAGPNNYGNGLFGIIEVAK